MKEVICPFCKVLIPINKKDKHSCPNCRIIGKKITIGTFDYNVVDYCIDIEIDNKIYAFDSYKERNETKFGTLTGSRCEYFYKENTFTPLPDNIEFIVYRIKRILNLKAFL